MWRELGEDDREDYIQKAEKVTDALAEHKIRPVVSHRIECPQQLTLRDGEDGGRDSRNTRN